MILDKLSKLGARERTGLMVAGLVVLGLLVDRLVVQSVVRRSAELKQQIVLESNQLDFNRQVLAREEVARAQYAEAMGQVDRVASSAEAIDQMKDEIDRIAGDSGINLASWEERRPVMDEETGAYEIHFVSVRQFEAGMDALLRFVHDVRASGGLLRIEELQLAPDKDTGRLTGSMLITKIVVVEAEGGSKAADNEG